VFFYARTSRTIAGITTAAPASPGLFVVRFAGTEPAVEVRVGLSFVSMENARLNLETELAGRSFAEVRRDASATWESLLGRIRVTGGTERQQGLFYSCLYRSFLWPALRSDVNGEFTDEAGRVVRRNFSYYTIPSLWDDYRNKLVLLGIMAPKVTTDVIQSMIDRGNVTGFMPTFFHGDHAAPFISGTYLRGLRDFDVQRAYELLVHNATVENQRARPHVAEYITNGYVATPAVEHPTVGTKSTAGVTKTLEYAYDDYALALLARELKDAETERAMRKRAGNYANVFDPSTGLMRGRQADGSWVTPFDPQFPYYEYMYREANAWQSSFFAPHDTAGLIKLFPSPDAFERQLDRLFTLPWNPGHIAMNVNSFIGQYCHGNQPDHGFPYLYYWMGRQEKSQAILNEILERFYGMEGGHTLCGMDDAGEMSSWYVFNALGLYPYSPADEDYIVTVPLFDRVTLRVADQTVTIAREGGGPQTAGITWDGRPIDGYFVPHHALAKGGALVIRTQDVNARP
jgi:predicted alpha-1,2-mannosidase